ncbi:MAG: HD domain-containing protein [Thermodesulfobacteriota bacterium]|jgi:putative nucleotidyltransferase with HDIG domain
MADFIPSRQTCLTLMDQEGMLPNIKAHSLQVARIALCLGKNLMVHFPKLNLDLVDAGALLHDIAKTECLKTRANHALVGEEKVRAMGFDSLAPIVAQHVLLEDKYFQNGCLDEVVLVHYADKRVRHEEVVDLEERFAYLVETYGRSREAVQRIEALYQDTLKVEEMIFLHLSFPPQALRDHLEMS